MILSAETLHSMLPQATDRNISKFLSPINVTLEEFNITTSLRIAAFLAQIGHESASLHYVEEIASGSAYEYREDLGNMEFEALQIAHANYNTTGKWYKGRGLIQITGYYNYKKCGLSLHIDCLHHPRLLCEPIYAARSAGWFWNTHKCNILADKQDFKGLTKTINGGYTGYSDRLALYNTNKTILNIA